MALSIPSPSRNGHQDHNNLAQSISELIEQNPELLNRCTHQR
jgi:hypothetical protein